MARATRTTNPLHFEDLEPHRFEDLVRQLIYDFRDWSLLEAIGRSGSDDGIDIRGLEVRGMRQREFELTDEEAVDDIREHEVEQRIWLIQCKRYQSLGPRQIEKIVQDNLGQATQNPYGHILVAPCDFSLAARERFMQTARTLGVQECYMLGKAELEDMLFRPSNDHLLFAYFGISLQIRRRTTRTQLRANLTLKRALIKHFGELNDRSYKDVLIRDPEDAEYPRIDDEEFWTQPRWRYYEFFGHEPVNHVAFVRRKCYAFYDSKTDEWDALTDYDDRKPYPELFDAPEKSTELALLSREYQALWSDEIPNRNQAWYLELALIPYDRILAIDELGDAYNVGPHLLVDFRQSSEPFEERIIRLIEPIGASGKSLFNVEKLKRVDYLTSLRNRRRTENTTRSKDELTQELLQRMARLRDKFMQNTVIFISKWYADFVVNRIKSNSELGDEKLAEINSRVKDLQENAEAIVRSNLETASLWWDLEPSDQSYAYYGNRAPEALDEAIRFAAGALSTPLKETGLLNPSENWRKTSDRYVRETGAKPYFPNWIEWSEDMRQTIEQYESLCSRARRMRYQTYEVDSPEVE